MPSEERLPARSERFRDERRALLDSAPAVGLHGLELIRALTKLSVGFVVEVARPLVEGEPGWAVLAIGGTGRGEICPGSDLDVLLLHPSKAPPKTVGARAEQLWYPLWDAGLKVTPAVHSVESAVALSDREVVSAVTWLSASHLVGDAVASAAFVQRTAARWQERARQNLRRAHR